MKLNLICSRNVLIISFVFLMQITPENLSVDHLENRTFQSFPCHTKLCWVLSDCFENFRGSLCNESAKLRGLRGLMGRVGAWVHGCVGGMGQTLAWVAWVHKILAWVKKTA